MLGGVAGGGQRPQRQPAQASFVAVAEPAVAELDAPRCRGEHLSPIGSELTAPGDEIGVQVRLSGVGDGEPARLGGGQVPAGITFRVDDQRPAVFELHQIGSVPQALIDQDERRRGTRHSRSGSQAGAAGRMMGGHAGLVPATMT